MITRVFIFRGVFFCSYYVLILLILFQFKFFCEETGLCELTCTDIFSYCPSTSAKYNKFPRD